MGICPLEVKECPMLDYDKHWQVSQAHSINSSLTYRSLCLCQECSIIREISANDRQTMTQEVFLGAVTIPTYITAYLVIHCKQSELSFHYELIYDVGEVWRQKLGVILYHRCSNCNHSLKVLFYSVPCVCIIQSNHYSFLTPT